jgi:hypothetical protein
MLSHNLVGKISVHFKNTPCISYFIVPQKLNVILFLDIAFFKYFFRVLHEASSSWLKLCWFILGHPVVHIKAQIFDFHFLGVEQNCLRTN